MKGKEKKHKNSSDKQKLEAITNLLKQSQRKQYDSGIKRNFQEITIPVADNDELRYLISRLLRVCILALENENTFSSPNLSNCSKTLTIASILELIDNLLPDVQLATYDSIERLLLHQNEDKG